MGDNDPDRFNNDQGRNGAQGGVGLNAQDLSTAGFNPQERASSEFQPRTFQSQGARSEELATEALSTAEKGETPRKYKTRPRDLEDEESPPTPQAQAPAPVAVTPKETQPVFTNEEGAANTTIDLGLKIGGVLSASFSIVYTYDGRCCGDQKTITISTFSNPYPYTYTCEEENVALTNGGNPEKTEKCAPDYAGTMVALGFMALVINAVFVPSLLLMAAKLKSSTQFTDKQLSWPFPFPQTNHFIGLNAVGKRAFRLQIFAISFAVLGGFFGLICCILPIEAGQGSTGAYTFLISSLQNIVLAIYAYWQVLAERGRQHLKRKQERKFKNEEEFIAKLEERKRKQRKEVNKFTKEFAVNQLKACFSEPIEKFAFYTKQAFPFF